MTILGCLGSAVDPSEMKIRDLSVIEKVWAITDVVLTEYFYQNDTLLLVLLVIVV